MVKLIAYQVLPGVHPSLLERVREIYNENLSDLATKPLTYLSSRQQQTWWTSIDHTKITLHVYSPAETPWDICAFSKVTDRGSFSTPIYAVDKRWWRRGYGTEIIRHSIEVAGKPLYAEHLLANEVIRRIHMRAGWASLGMYDGVEYLYHPGLNPDQRQQEIYDEIIRYRERR